MVWLSSFISGLWTEEMIRGLQQLGWKKVDVSFHSAMWPFFAHNNIHVMIPFNICRLRCFLLFDYNFGWHFLIQVKNEWIHNAGVGVIAHVADSLKQQESSQIVIASL